MMTVAQFIASMDHCLGRTAKAEVPALVSFNQAGRHLFDAHDWAWRFSECTVRAVAGQTTIELPMDFGDCLTCRVSNSGAGVVSVVGSQRFAEIAGGNDVSPGGYVATFGTAAPVVGEVGPLRPVVRIYPTPVSDGVPTLRIAYQRRWVDVTEPGAAAVPPIPPEFERALELMARQMHAVKNRALTDQDKAERAELQAELDQRRGADCERRGPIGKLRGPLDVASIPPYSFEVVTP